MITEVRLQNIRLFDKDEWTFDLRPLTVICGTNSSGKSTIIKSLLLLSRALSTDPAESKLPVMALADREIDVGPYEAFVSHGDVTLDASIGLTIDAELDYGDSRALLQRSAANERIQIKCTYVFAADKISRIAELSPSSERRSNSYRARLKSASTTVRHKGEVLFGWDISQRYPGNNSGPYVITLDEQSAQRLDVAHLFGDGFPSLGDTATDVLSREILLNGLFPGYIAGPAPRASLSPGSGPQMVYYQLPYQITLVGRLISTNLKQVQYLGPLRAAAERYYILKGSEGIEVDSASGQFLARVLRSLPEHRAYAPPITGGSPRWKPLSETLNAWLYYLRTGERAEAGDPELTIYMTKDVLLEAELKTANGLESHALADSGFGYSQVLPIVIRALIAPPETTVLLEEPEVHLNPALQVRLAEFFLSMAAARKQLIIETHSEHLVNAFRVLIAESPQSDASKRIEIVYIDSSLRRPRVREMSIYKDGSVPDWPPEFFGEAVSLTKRLIAAQRKARADITVTFADG